MINYKIQLVENLPETIKEKMSNGFLEYETSHNIHLNYNKFALVLVDSLDNTFGCLTAYTAFAEIYVDDLWVDKSLRNKGYGTKLLQNLYNRFENEGFNNINLVTSNFQAPEFYIKCGFNVEYIRINKYNPQFTKTFFIKYFKNELQNQGILSYKL